MENCADGHRKTRKMKKDRHLRQNLRIGVGELRNTIMGKIKLLDN